VWRPGRAVLVPRLAAIAVAGLVIITLSRQQPGQASGEAEPSPATVPGSLGRQYRIEDGIPQMLASRAVPVAEQEDQRRSRAYGDPGALTRSATVSSHGRTYPSDYVGGRSVKRSVRQRSGMCGIAWHESVLPVIRAGPPTRAPFPCSRE
jgi:hypothetical protein